MIIKSPLLIQVDICILQSQVLNCSTIFQVDNVLQSTATATVGSSQTADCCVVGDAAKCMTENDGDTEYCVNIVGEWSLVLLFPILDYHMLLFLAHLSVRQHFQTTSPLKP